MKINTKSIAFKTAVIYFFITLINITIFDLMVYENQVDLIMQNAVINSHLKGSNLKNRIDKIVGSTGELNSTNLNKILKESSILGVSSLTVYDETGRIFVEMKESKLTKRAKAEMEELKMINLAITKQSFEDKLFYSHVDKVKRIIYLYVPFPYNGEKIGVAALDLHMDDIGKQYWYLYLQCIIIALLIIGVHLVFAIVFAKMILMPLRKLNEATHLISEGNLDIRVPIVRDDEIGQLASSFNEMGVAIQRMRDEAKGANPLTGLPGNISIANYIDSCLSARMAISVLYCDLDNFKAYNDKYGFTKGDEAILYTRDCLITIARKKGLKDIFVGHEGGDDFVVVSPFEFWEDFAKSFITIFDRGVYQFYNSVDARNGFIESVNRKGERQRFPLMSISVAVVTNKTRPFTRHAEMIQIAAEVKKYVKSIDGSCYAIDRRTGPVGPGAEIMQQQDAKDQGP